MLSAAKLTDDLAAPTCQRYRSKQNWAAEAEAAAVWKTFFGFFFSLFTPLICLYNQTPILLIDNEWVSCEAVQRTWKDKQEFLLE